MVRCAHTQCGLLMLEPPWFISLRWISASKAASRAVPFPKQRQNNVLWKYIPPSNYLVSKATHFDRFDQNRFRNGLLEQVETVRFGLGRNVGVHWLSWHGNSWRTGECTELAREFQSLECLKCRSRFCMRAVTDHAFTKRRTQFDQFAK